MDTSKIHIIVRKISPLLCLFVTQPQHSNTAGPHHLPSSGYM